MDRNTLKEIQAPLKQLYREQPESALISFCATGVVDFETPGCRSRLLTRNTTEVIAGLHPMAGGSSSLVCSAELFLQSLVTCAGTTLAAVSISMGMDLRSASVTAAGLLDFRGTLGIDRETPVGFSEIELVFKLPAGTETEKAQKLIQLTERYCVVYQTIVGGVSLTSRIEEY